MQDKIVIRGAREHNLKNINLSLPRDTFIVITGLSGSGKSTLAFDTIYAEGQRRYVESLSAYARQFLNLMNKPDVDSIDGLSPAISIEQKTTSKNPRSTVGTVTEIYDYLRLLFARIGTPYCPLHNTKIEQQTAAKIADSIVHDQKGKKISVYAPVIRDKKGTYESLIEDFRKEGIVKVRVNGKLYGTDEKISLERYKKHTIEPLIDEVKATQEESDRILEAVETALSMADGLVLVNDQLYSEHMACPACGLVFEELQPRMFSFNTPYGACEDCHGLGYKQEIDPDLIIPDQELCIAEGAIAAYRNAVDGWRGQQLASVGKAFGFDPLLPINKFSKAQYHILLYGTDSTISFRYTSKNKGSSFHFNGNWEGIVPQLERLYQQTESDYRRREIEKFMRILPCPGCKGKRLKEKVLSVKIHDKSIIDVTDLSIENALGFFYDLKLTKKEEAIAKLILKEIVSRLEFLKNVGLNYLSLSRSAGTLSGGEAQRIRLATQIGANLTGVLYVLDEPSIGLHQRDNKRLIGTLHKLRDLGNTLIVVEHDEETIEHADYVVDIGPGAGVHGGKIVATGTPQDILANEASLTGQYLSKKKVIAYRKERRKATGHIEIKGAAENNLKNIDVKFPTGVMTVVTGVSGSGKSSLVHHVLYKALMKKIYQSRVVPGKHKSLSGAELFEKVIIIDQSPIGKTPRSNPATYTKVFDEVRLVFSSTPEAKIRGYQPGRFSFNVKGGRCEKCQGDGLIKIEMNFLPDVYVECDDCKGKRYNRETLEVKYKHKSIADVLAMSVEEAALFFENFPSIKRKLDTLLEVGLGYIKLGQSSTTLSGGESQRIKLTRELAKKNNDRTLYLLDEPTTGLHFHDINNLLQVLNRLVDSGSTMIIIEHNFDIIKNADHIIDIGPEGGDGGGMVVAAGTPEELLSYKHSHTAMFLKNYLE
ncbi:MAG: excinuclease ABC subunit UvrA [Candidatus Woesearchaeota archaeon]|nr:MAG: excinuclease ABC subunit UvrA [Candidatus Woesearchaeota archaeon]